MAEIKISMLEVDLTNRTNCVVDVTEDAKKDLDPCRSRRIRHPLLLGLLPGASAT